MCRSSNLQNYLPSRSLSISYYYAHLKGKEGGGGGGGAGATAPQTFSSLIYIFLELGSVKELKNSVGYVFKLFFFLLKTDIWPN